MSEREKGREREGLDGERRNGGRKRERGESERREGQSRDVGGERRERDGRHRQTAKDAIIHNTITARIRGKVRTGQSQVIYCQHRRGRKSKLEVMTDTSI